MQVLVRNRIIPRFCQITGETKRYFRANYLAIGAANSRIKQNGRRHVMKIMQKKTIQLFCLIVDVRNKNKKPAPLQQNLTEDK